MTTDYYRQAESSGGCYALSHWRFGYIGLVEVLVIAFVIGEKTSPFRAAMLCAHKRQTLDML